MNKNSIITILAALVVLMTIGIIVTDFRRKKDGGGGPVPPEPPQSTNTLGQTSTPERKPQHDNSTGNVNTNVEGKVEKKPALPDPVQDPGQVIDEKRLREFNDARLSRRSRRHGKERRRVSERAAVNLPKQDRTRVFENTFIITGGCEWSTLALKNESKFLFDAVLIAKSEIEDLKTLPGQELRIVEKRTIDTAREKLIITDASLKIDLKSSPIDQINGIAKAVAGISAAVAGALTPIPIGATIAGSIAAGAGAVCGGIKIAKQFDGADVSSFVGKENMKRLHQSFVDKKVKSIKTLLRAMEGKSYRVVYTQEPAPSKKYMQVTWEHFDGTPLTYDEDFILAYNLISCCENSEFLGTYA